MNQDRKVELLFDAVLHLYSGGGSSFERTIEGKKLCLKPKQVQAFVAKQIHNIGISGYSVTEDGKKAIQAFTGTTDFDKITTNVWNAFQEADTFDVGWQRAFRKVPLRKGQLEWSIGTVTSGVVLKLLEEGEKVVYSSVKGTAVKGGVDLYGGGLQLSWKALESRDLASFFNAVLEFRNKRMSKYAELHYALLYAAAALTTVSYQLTSSSSTLDRDIATLDKAYNTVGKACKDKGFGDTANAMMLFYTSPQNRGRINQAIRVTSSEMALAGGRGQALTAKIEPVYTWDDSIPTGKGLLTLPGNKLQNSVYMDEKSFERIDPDNLNWLKSSFTAFGAIAGETDQCCLVSLEDS